MTKPVRLRSLADDGIDDAIVHFQHQGGAVVASRFIDAIERTFTRISRHPHAGALRYSYELGIPELRYVPLARFPYAVFYLDATSEVDVWRVLHNRCDLPAILTNA